TRVEKSMGIAAVQCSNPREKIIRNEPPLTGMFPMPDSHAFSSIRAIVTGHTRGLGEALAEALLTRGIAVLGLSRAKHTTLTSRDGTAFEQVELDLSNVERISQWLAGNPLQRFIGDAQRVLLFNNAGTVQPIGPFDAQQPTAVAQSVILNVAAPLMLSSA